MKIAALLLPILTLSTLIPCALGQEITWSSKNCSACSSVSIPSYYTDGSGLFTENASMDNDGSLAGISLGENFLIAAVGFANFTKKPIEVNPTQAVTLDAGGESLSPLPNVPAEIPKGTREWKKHFKNDEALKVKSGKVAAGFLFFPMPHDASRVTIVVTIGTDKFRFPFKQDQTFRAKFLDPDAPPGGFESATQPIPASSCVRNISFAVIEGGAVISRIPNFAEKWLRKNAKNFSKLCFSQAPISGSANYLFVFSTSREALSGIDPVVRQSTSVNTEPVSGSGTVTDSSGSMWDYTYSGTETTTTTTTSSEDVPYTVNSNTLYLYAYDQNGRLVSRRWRTVSTREGGNPYNSLGYNLGAALGSIHFKERLLKDVLKDVQLSQLPTPLTMSPSTSIVQSQASVSNVPTAVTPQGTVSCSSAFLYDKEIYTGERKILEVLETGAHVSIEAETGTTIEYRVRTQNGNEGYVERECISSQ